LLFIVGAVWSVVGEAVQLPDSIIDIGYVLLSIGFIWIGYTLWSGREVEALHGEAQVS